MFCEGITSVYLPIIPTYDEIIYILLWIIPIKKVERNIINYDCLLDGTQFIRPSRQKHSQGVNWKNWKNIVQWLVWWRDCLLWWHKRSLILERSDTLHTRQIHQTITPLVDRSLHEQINDEEPERWKNHPDSEQVGQRREFVCRCVGQLLGPFKKSWSKNLKLYQQLTPCVLYKLIAVGAQHWYTKMLHHSSHIQLCIILFCEQRNMENKACTL